MIEPTPVPVVIIESSGHTLEIWLVASTLALTLVTALSLVAIVHQDHEMVKLLRDLVTRLIPARRNGQAAGKQGPIGDDPVGAEWRD